MEIFEEVEAACVAVVVVEMAYAGVEMAYAGVEMGLLAGAAGEGAVGDAGCAAAG